MFDHNAYRERCSELHISEEALQEVIEMAEQKQKKTVRRPMRVGLIAAALCALLIVTVSAANPELLEGLLVSIRSSVSVGDYREDLTMESGEQVIALREPEAAVEERDGRMFLVVDGEETDITEAMAEDGSYHWERRDEGAVVRVTVTLDENGEPVTISNVELPDTAGQDTGMSMVTESRVGE